MAMEHFSHLEGVIIVLIGFAVLLVIGLAVFIMFLMYLPLKRIPHEYRKMEPGLVFLNLIPIFGLGWLFYTVICINDSFNNYFNAKEMARDVETAKNVGIAWAVCNIVSFFPLVGTLAALAGLVLMIIYLVKINQMKNEISVTL